MAHTKFNIAPLFSTFILFVWFLQSSFAQPAWVSRYNNPDGNLQTGTVLTADNFGDLFVSGINSLSPGDADIVTIKYNTATGDTVWVNRYGGSANLNDAPAAIITDNAGNVYVTGWVFNTGTTRDMFISKYDVATGNLVWVRTYNGAGNGGDYSFSIAVDGNNNVYITGRSDVGNAAQRFTTIKYNSSGVMQWLAIYTPDLPVTGIFDEARSVKVDGNGNVYVSGSSRFSPSPASEDYLTLKYNSSGILQWFKRHNGNLNSDDYVVAMVLDGVPNVYVAGYSNRYQANYDYVTIKYEGTTGDSIAAAVFNGQGGGVDVTTAMAIDNSSNIFITGWSQGGFGTDYETIKYNSNLSQQWATRFVRFTNLDVPAAMVVNPTGDVYVTGSTPNSGMGYDYLTIEYSSMGGLLALDMYNGSANSNDYAKSIAIDGAGNVYITGSAVFGTPADTDMVTIKYGPMLTGIHPVSNEIPAEYSLSQNYPNPFNPNTAFHFGIPRETFVKISVYDIMGKEIAVLLNQIVKAGKYRMTWNANGFSSGIYFYRITGGDFSSTKKMILNK
jgi:type IX secretion system substrate protein/beta-propeller repeat-containing protein